VARLIETAKAGKIFASNFLKVTADLLTAQTVTRKHPCLEPGYGKILRAQLRRPEEIPVFLADDERVTPFGWTSNLNRVGRHSPSLGAAKLHPVRAIASGLKGINRRAIVFA